MAQQIKKVEALRTHISHLKCAVATTTCRKTVDVLRQMLSDAEAKLRASEVRWPEGNITGHDDLLQMESFTSAAYNIQ